MNRVALRMGGGGKGGLEDGRSNVARGDDAPAVAQAGTVDHRGASY